MKQFITKFCACCGSLFDTCKKCYRGQVYCSVTCRIAGYRERHREAQRKYRKTKKGKKQHKDAEGRRRKKQQQGKKKKPHTIVKSCMCLLMIMKSLIKNIDSIKDRTCSECNKTFEGTVEYVDISYLDLNSV